MRKVFSLIMGIALMVASFVPVYATNLIINNQSVLFTETSGKPFIDAANRTQVPFRQTMEAFGANVSWIQSEQTAIAEKDDIVVKVPIGERFIYRNDIKVTNDTAALIKSGRTYLPIRAVFEAFGATVDWDNSTNTVLVNSNVQNSYIKVPTSYLNEAIPVLKEKITFENDIRTFTLYAFMNYTGYDDNNGYEMPEVRKRIRKELEGKKLSLSDNTYYRSKGVENRYYAKALRYMSGSPDFKYVKSLPNYLNSLNDLPFKLAEFYQKADIESLYIKYNPEYQEALSEYSKQSYEAIAKINYFLKIDNENVEPFGFEVNLLDAMYRGYGLGDIDNFKGYGVISTGPSNKPNILNVTHEYLHGITNPIVNNNLSNVNKLEYLMIPTFNSAYSEWRSIFEESIVRALSPMAVNNEDAEYMAQYETQRGFVLTQYFYERFDEFQYYDGTLDLFINKLIDDRVRLDK